jgi:hypothetical protein
VPSLNIIWQPNCAIGACRRQGRRRRRERLRFAQSAQ